MDLLRASCLLHDIAKYPCIVDGKGWHDKRGQEMLDNEGLPRVGRIIVSHVVIRSTDGDDIREEHLLNYSDKRVVHDKVASLEERFQYLAETYGKIPRALDLLQELKGKTLELERRIFRELDFGPEDVPRLLEKSSEQS
jgi:hypothetical protein